MNGHHPYVGCPSAVAHTFPLPPSPLPHSFIPTANNNTLRATFNSRTTSNNPITCSASEPALPITNPLNLSPYLNFLLDLNTLDLANQQTSQPAKNPTLLKVSRSSTQNQLPVRSKCHGGPQKTPAIPTLSSKEITNRLDRLEVQLSKIVDNVVKTASTTTAPPRSSSHLRRCLSPVTTTDVDEADVTVEEKKNEKRQDCLEAVVDMRGRRAQRFDDEEAEFESCCFRRRSGQQRGLRAGWGDRVVRYRLLPPASFEDEEPEIRPARIRPRKEESQAKLEQEVKCTNGSFSKWRSSAQFDGRKLHIRPFGFWYFFVFKNYLCICRYLILSGAWENTESIWRGNSLEKLFRVERFLINC